MRTWAMALQALLFEDWRDSGSKIDLSRQREVK
jgi:hypothetical protein